MEYIQKMFFYPFAQWLKMGVQAVSTFRGIAITKTVAFMVNDDLIKTNP